MTHTSSLKVEREDLQCGDDEEQADTRAPLPGGWDWEAGDEQGWAGAWSGDADQTWAGVCEEPAGQGLQTGDRVSGGQCSVISKTWDTGEPITMSEI